VEREEQESKQRSPRISTLAGTETILSGEHRKKALCSIRNNLESQSNVTAEREEHEWKQEPPRIVTAAGIEIEVTDGQI
jgi:hypothetical protein